MASMAENPYGEHTRGWGMAYGPGSMSTASQLARYRQGQSMGDMRVGDSELFRLRRGESPEIACQRLRAILTVWKTTMYSRWSCRAVGDGVLVKKIGERTVCGMTVKAFRQMVSRSVTPACL